MPSIDLASGDPQIPFDRLHENAQERPIVVVQDRNQSDDEQNVERGPGFHGQTVTSAAWSATAERGRRAALRRLLLGDDAVA